MNNIINKEIKLDTDGLFSIKYGCVGNIKPIVIYIKVRAKVKPSVNKQYYDDDIKSMKRKTKSFVDKYIKSLDFVEHKYLFNNDVTENGLSFNKPSHFKYELHIIPKDTSSLEGFTKIVSDITKAINNEVTKIYNEVNISIC